MVTTWLQPWPVLDFATIFASLGHFNMITLAASVPWRGSLTRVVVAAMADARLSDPLRSSAVNITRKAMMIIFLQFMFPATEFNCACILAGQPHRKCGCSHGRRYVLFILLQSLHYSPAVFGPVGAQVRFLFSPPSLLQPKLTRRFNRHGFGLPEIILEPSFLLSIHTHVTRIFKLWLHWCLRYCRQFI